MHNTIQLIGNLGRDPEQREARANGAPFTVLSVATRRAWKNAEGNWESRTDWHRVFCFQRIGEGALALHKGDQVFVAGSLVSSKYDRTVGNGKKPVTLKLHIVADSREQPSQAESRGQEAGRNCLRLSGWV